MQATLQARNDADAVQTDTARTVAQKRVLADSRPEALVQRKLAEMINNSPRVLQQRALSDAIYNSSRMVAQRRQMNALFGGTVKPQGAGAMQAGASQVQREEKKNHTGLPNQLKSGIESLSGISMDHVKVHYNSDKPAQLQAHAYAQGSVIHLGAGQEKHLPHEAWHVVQQRQGRVKPTIQLKGGVLVNDDDGLEHEADVMGARAAQLKPEPMTGAFTVARAVATEVAQREIRSFVDDQNKRIEVMLPDGSSVHLERDSGDTVAQMKAYFVAREGWSPASILVSEDVGVDLPLHDTDLLVPSCIYRVALMAERDSLKEPANAEKVGVAQKVDDVLAAIGYDALLGGGGAVALYGSGRDIKDLDFKMGDKLKAAYSEDMNAVMTTIVNALAAQGLNVDVETCNRFVLRLIVVDASSKSHPIEVSLTPTGKYSAELRRVVPVGGANITVVGPMELLLDKLFAFSERSVKEIGKLETDFIDIVTMLDLSPSLESPGYLEERVTAYRKKFNREKGTAVDAKTVNAYKRLAPDIGLQVAMRTSLLLSDSTLRESVGLRQLRLWIHRVGKVARALQGLAKPVPPSAGQNPPPLATSSSSID
jgi:hypothetical protein